MLRKGSQVIAKLVCLWVFLGAYHFWKRQTVTEWRDNTPTSSALVRDGAVLHVADDKNNVKSNSAGVKDLADDKLSRSIQDDEGLRWIHSNQHGCKTEALKVLKDWTKKWLVNINTRKTTYTIFSLSPKELKANLKLCGQTLQADNTPTYLGVTFDRRLTWKQQTEKVEARAKLRLALMKKLTGTTWGADAAILKKMYVGSVRPVLEYGVTAWGTAAKSNFDRVSKVQNQAARIITGTMRSTPIQELENIMGLDRRDTKLLTQAAKFKRLPTHPMKDRLCQPTKGILKRGSFIHQTRVLERRHQDILDQQPKDIPQYLKNQSWSDEGRPQIRCSIPGVGKKDSQSCAELKSLTIEHIHNSYPQRQWTHVYTDGSADQVVRSGGAGIYIKYPGGREEEHISLATGLYSTNFKAEAVALQTGAAHIEHSPLSSNNVVFFSDA
ncbi:uncharacterized protein, partial [Littorina saxatilis]|uniref:uncharacterized protein n=1 Tax=Littorina saxatilis TaxID=31220 RepID=UPI0038B4C2F8